MRSLLLAIFASLAACSPLQANTSGNFDQTISNVAAPSASSDPRIQLGRWAQVWSTAGLQTTAFACVTDEGLDRLASPLPAGCTSSGGFRPTADGWVNDIECTGGRGLDHIRIVVTGDLRQHHVTDMTMTPGISSPVRIHVEATYQGDCRGDEGDE